MTTLTRGAANRLLSALDMHVRAAAKPPAKPAEESSDTGQETGQPLPSAADVGDVPEDPEGLMELILTEIREQLDWDGTAGDPNESVAELEDALADMFDANVEIVWNGEDKLLLRVEGEEPVPLTYEYLGDLLEALAKQGGDAEAAAPEGDAAERGHVGWERGRKFGGGGNFDESKVNRDPGGEGGGRFVKKGTSAAGAAVGAAKAASSKAGNAGGDGGTAGKSSGPKASDLAKKAKGRGGRRATAKAIGNSLSAGTGGRVKVQANNDGTYNVGLVKKRMGSRKAAIVMLGVWTASAAASAATMMILGPGSVTGLGYSTYKAADLVRQLRAGGVGGNAKAV